MKANIQRITPYFGIVFLSLLIFILTFSLAAFSFDHKIILGSIIYFTTTLVLLKYSTNFKPIFIILVISVPIILVLFFFNVLQFNDTIVSIPSNSFLLISTLTAYFFYKSKNYLLPFSFILLCFFWMYSGKKMFFNYISFGSINGKVNEKMPATAMYESSGIETKVSSIPKTLILDFWNSRCGVCYAQFPFVDSINKIIDTAKYALFVVNIPFKEEKKEDNFKLLDPFNYSFKKVFVANESVMDSFKITSFPTTLVVKQNDILFRGEFSDALKFLKIK